MTDVPVRQCVYCPFLDGEYSTCNHPDLLRREADTPRRVPLDSVMRDPPDWCDLRSSDAHVHLVLP